MLNEIRNEDMVKFAVTGKLGLLSTLAPDGFPHVSLISSQAKNDKQMMWGHHIRLEQNIHRKTAQNRFFILIWTKTGGGAPFIKKAKLPRRL